MEYAQAREGVGEGLRALAIAVDDVQSMLGDREASTGAELREAAERLNARFVLAVVGEFSSGKSFLLNALLGKVAFEDRGAGRRIVGLLATDINPSTATITELEYAAEERAVAIYPDGREERIPIDRLSRFVAVGGDEGKLHDATRDERSAPTHVRVGVDSPFLQGGFIVADTPGLASINPAHRRATLAYLPSTDAVLYLIDTQTPFTEGDAAFLGIVRTYIESVFIVQTKIDLWRMPEGNAEAWESAYRRIAAQAAQHAPGTKVFPVSARDYAEGLLGGGDTMTARSRFRPFLETLDASLIATGGRSRLRRAAVLASDAVNLAEQRLDALANALALPPDAVSAIRTANVSALRALDVTLAGERLALKSKAEQTRERVRDLGATMLEDLLRGLGQTLDISDVARLRDRGKLHVLVDTTVAVVVGNFAEQFAETVGGALEQAASEGRTSLRDAAAAGLEDFASLIADARIEALEIAAPAFEATAGVGTWATALAPALRSTVVLGAIGGPAVTFVHGIAARFAAAPPGAYMKRELSADLRSTFFPALEADISAFVTRLERSVMTSFAILADAFERLIGRVSGAALGSLDRATQLRSAEQASNTLARIETTRVALRTHVEALSSLVSTFSASIESSDRTDRAASELTAHVERAPFDAGVYERGLRPTRWRVGVLGALKRGKSSLINAIAGERVLTDEGSSEEVTFPVHVRYGPQHRAFSLDSQGAWIEIPIAGAAAAAVQSPVLIEVPWTMPPELVLVHAPPFDSGDPYAEDIALAVAHASNETLCLFSRQLSDRELAMYEDVAQQGKPLLFAHTLADHESSGERRSVVELAQRYLQERGIMPGRMFTVSTLDYREAQAAGRAASGWNELGALISTIETHAEEHMSVLERRERDRAKAGTAPVSTQDVRAERPSLFRTIDRIFRRR